MRFDDRTLAPYQGEKPFVFLSYSHKDAEEAQEILAAMNRFGYRVWYDEGLVPGKEWDETIAQKITSCSYFIALISRSYLDSSNCRDELNFAREQEKPRLLIYLEEVDLPVGMQMRLGRLLAIHKNKYTGEAFLEKLFSSEGLEQCGELPFRPRPAPIKQRSGSQADRQTRPSGKTARILGAVLLALAVLALIWWKPWKPAQTPPSPSAATSSPAEEAAAPAPEPVSPAPELLEAATPAPEPASSAPEQVEAAAPAPEPASSAPEQVETAATQPSSTAAAPVSPLQLLKQAANADRLSFPEVSDCFSESAARYISAPKGHSVEAYGSWSSSGSAIGYVYHGSRVRVLAEHGNYSCLLYYTEKNALSGAWVSTKYLTDSYPGKVWQLGDPAGASGAENRGDPACSWSTDLFPETGTRFTLLDEPVKSCVGFTLDYQLISKSGAQEVFGPRSVYVNDGSGWTWVGDFDYGSQGPCHVEVFLDHPMDLAAVAAIANVRDPDGFTVRQSLLDVKCR